MIRFDANMYHDSLAFYGKALDYPRTFSLKTFIGREGTPVTAPCRCHAPTASREGLAVWVQANETEPTYPIKKPGNADITVVRTITTDCELPADPRRALAVGVEFAQALVDNGLAEHGQPVEDSGAGPHICVPIMPIVTAEHGGGVIVNDAVERVVDERFLPLFTAIAARHGLGDMVLGSYDIARVLSVPGTFRPPHNKPDDAAYLAHGYLRCWLPPYDRTPPQRRESAFLAQLIIEAVAAIRAEHARREQYEPPIGQSTGGRPGDAFNSTTGAREVARLLVAHGWRIDDDRDADRIVLSRPGKDSGTSGTIRSDRGIPIFYSFSDGCAPFHQKKGYAPFGVYLTLEHQGDAIAAAKALAAQGYGRAGTVEVRPNGKTVRRVSSCGPRAVERAGVAR
jgi:hypothetical protein